jgi:hypothetical protein
MVLDYRRDQSAHLFEVYIYHVSTFLKKRRYRDSRTAIYGVAMVGADYSAFVTTTLKVAVISG